MARPSRIWVSPDGTVWVYRADDNTWVKFTGGGNGPTGPAFGSIVAQFR